MPDLLERAASVSRPTCDELVGSEAPGATGIERPAVIPLTPAAELRVLLAAWGATLQPADAVEPRLAGVVRQVLGHPGSMVRGQLALAVGRAGGLGAPAATGLAVAVELFHSASLVFDDLPAMDDATTRRGLACPHRVWGEGPAILGALALITRGYACLGTALAGHPAAVQVAATELVERCLGLDGLVGGQAADLGFGAAVVSGEARAAQASLSAQAGIDGVQLVAAGKSVPLLRLALELPALVAGVREGCLRALVTLAHTWGLAYQALDDLKDRCLGTTQTGKTSARDGLLGRPNLGAVVGDEMAIVVIDDLLAASDDPLSVIQRELPNPTLPALRRVLQQQRDVLGESLATQRRLG